MSVARTARRRRKQAAHGFRHMDKKKRPRYRKGVSGRAVRRAQIAAAKAADQRSRESKPKK